jgi:O-antigen/teichoic acid export membrane protein
MWSTAHLLQSILTLGVAQLISWVATAALTIVIPRYLGDVSLGRLAFALATTTTLGLLADIGITTYLGKEIARGRLPPASLLANALAMRIPLALVAAIASIAIVVYGGQDEESRALVYACSVAMILDSAGNVLLATLQGLGRLRAMALTLVTTKVVYAALGIGSLIAGFGSMGVAFAGAASLAVGGAMSLRAVRASLPVRLRVSLPEWRAIASRSLPFLVWQAGLVVYSTIDVVMLTFLTRDAVVGWYAAAERIVTITAFVPSVVMTVVFPALSAASHDPQAFGKLARRTLHSVVLVSLPLASGMMLVAGPLLDAFGYPPSFANSVLPLQLLALHIPLAAADTLIGSILVASDRQRQWAATAVAAAILNPLLNVAAIPLTQDIFGNGAVGASAVTTTTEVFMMIAGLRLMPRGVIDGATLVRLGKIVLAGALMAIAVWPVHQLALAIPVAVGALTYAAASLALRTFSIGEARAVIGHLRQRVASSTAAAGAGS